MPVSFEIPLVAGLKWAGISPSMSVMRFYLLLGENGSIGIEPLNDRQQQNLRRALLCCLPREFGADFFYVWEMLCLSDPSGGMASA